MKRCKKALALLLTFVLLLSICPVVFAETTVTNGTKVEFGSYPQTKITDEALMEQLNALTVSWNSYGYSYRVSGTDVIQTGDFMKYCDVDYNGVKYRGVKMSACRPDRTDSFFTTSLTGDYELSTVYWFRYEPLVWQVLDIDKGLLLCDQIIDAQPFRSGKINFNASASSAYRYTVEGDSSKYANLYETDATSIGGWLVQSFEKTAFTATQISQLKAAQNSTQYTHTATSDATDTKFRFADISKYGVFLLSAKEAYTYLKTQRGCQAAKSSDYAKIQGVEVYDFCSLEDDYHESSSAFYPYVGCSPWLLTTAGSKSETVICVRPDGRQEGYDVRYTGTGVRPAVSLQKTIINGLTKHTSHTKIYYDYSAPTCTNPGIEDKSGYYCTLCNYYVCPTYLDHTATAEGQDHNIEEYQTACTCGDAVQFGVYPQSRVTDEEVISRLNTLPLEWKSFNYYTFYDSVEEEFVKSDYMKYTDVDLDEDGKNDYRGVLFTQYRPGSAETVMPEKADDIKNCSVQDNNGYDTNTVYWFRYEPLVWRVLDRENGILMCEYAIDSQAFNDTVYKIDKNGNKEIDSDEYFADKKGEYYANDYAASSLRKFVNGTLLNTAFSSAEKKNIADTTVDVKTESSDNNSYRSEFLYKTVTDKIFFLSQYEYLFSGLVNSCEEKLSIQPTDYALCQGIYTFFDSKDTIFHLRSGYTNASNCSGFIGRGSEDNDYTDSTNRGICPVIRVNNTEELLHIHTLTFTQAVAATCTKDGKTQGVSCSDCGKSIVKAEKTEKTGHDSLWLAATEPTCEKQGNIGCYQCKNCKKYYSDSACSSELTEQDVILPALGHDWGLYNTITPATCTEKGEGNYACQREDCTASKTDEIPALGHNPEKVSAVAAACMSAGCKEYYRCKNKNCGKYFTTEKCTVETTWEKLSVPALGHDWEETVITPATCVKKGEVIRKCKRTGCTAQSTYQPGEDPANHENTELRNVSAATCGKAGYTGDTYCKDCGEKVKTGTVIQATGEHSWNAGEVTTPPTDEKEGIKTYTCSVCKQTKTEMLAKLEKTEEITPGDVDNNGKIEAADARLALRASVGLEKFDDATTKAADVDKNGKVEAADARLILRASVGLEDPEVWKI